MRKKGEDYGEEKGYHSYYGESEKLLEYINDHEHMNMDSIGFLLGSKFLESNPPHTLGSEWGFEGLMVFCKEHGIDISDSIEAALAKLK